MNQLPTEHTIDSKNEVPQLSGSKETWQLTCSCGTQWYGTKARVENSHKWHVEREVDHRA